MAIWGALGYWSSTTANIMLVEAKEIPIFSRFKHLGRNYVSRCYTSNNHPMVQLLEEVDNPGRGENEQPLISEYYNAVTPLRHLIQSGDSPPALNYTFESTFYEARDLSMREDKSRKQRITTRN
jgi:hypothetical protein